ncbi:MAG: hypothetical protein GY853_00300 [PVC group bacterium]|nr:hypothetical protein [PVC group bacterium]
MGFSGKKRSGKSISSRIITLIILQIFFVSGLLSLGNSFAADTHQTCLSPRVNISNALVKNSFSTFKKLNLNDLFEGFAEGILDIDKVDHWLVGRNESIAYEFKTDLVPKIVQQPNAKWFLEQILAEDKLKPLHFEAQAVLLQIRFKELGYPNHNPAWRHFISSMKEGLQFLENPENLENKDVVIGTCHVAADSDSVAAAITWYERERMLAENRGKVFIPLISNEDRDINLETERQLHICGIIAEDLIYAFPSKEMEKRGEVKSLIQQKLEAIAKTKYKSRIKIDLLDHNAVQVDWLKPFKVRKIYDHHNPEVDMPELAPGNDYVRIEASTTTIIAQENMKDRIFHRSFPQIKFLTMATLLSDTDCLNSDITQQETLGILSRMAKDMGFLKKVQLNGGIGSSGKIDFEKMERYFEIIVDRVYLNRHSYVEEWLRDCKTYNGFEFGQSKVISWEELSEKKEMELIEGMRNKLNENDDNEAIVWMVSSMNPSEYGSKFYAICKDDPDGAKAEQIISQVMYQSPVRIGLVRSIYVNPAIHAYQKDSPVNPVRVLNRAYRQFDLNLDRSTKKQMMEKISNLIQDYGSRLKRDLVYRYYSYEITSDIIEFLESKGISWIHAEVMKPEKIYIEEIGLKNERTRRVQMPGFASRKNIKNEVEGAVAEIIRINKAERTLRLNLRNEIMGADAAFGIQAKELVLQAI